MSGFIPGRQYRVTHTVTADQDGTIDCDFGVLRTDDVVAWATDVTAELLPEALPDTVNSVVLLSRDNPNGGARQRMPFQYEGDDYWKGMGGSRWQTRDLQNERDGPLHGEITILFDAGAAS